MTVLKASYPICSLLECLVVTCFCKPVSLTKIGSKTTNKSFVFVFRVRDTEIWKKSTIVKTTLRKQVDITFYKAKAQLLNIGEELKNMERNMWSK